MINEQPEVVGAGTSVNK